MKLHGFVMDEIQNAKAVKDAITFFIMEYGAHALIRKILNTLCINLCEILKSTKVGSINSLPSNVRDTTKGIVKRYE